MPINTFMTIKNTLIIPKKENPVSSDQIPNMPPMFAIWSDKANLDSKTVISTLEDGNFKWTMMIFLARFCACLEMLNMIGLFIDSSINVLLKSIRYSHKDLLPEHSDDDLHEKYRFRKLKESSTSDSHLLIKLEIWISF